MKHFISLGAGVQSSTMALMAAHGELTPMPEGAIFADTQDEPQSVYRWLNWLETKLPFPIYRVTAGHLMKSALAQHVSKKSGHTYLEVGLPVFLIVGDGGNGLGMRQCTRNFKITPIRRQLRKLRGGEPVTQWIGISFDELERMKQSRDNWCTNIWPLVDKGITRADCFAWMKEHGYPEPPRSACVYCPYHRDEEWLRLRSQEPNEFYKAILFEEKLQAAYLKATAWQKKTRVLPYLHDSRQPLKNVEFKHEQQLNLFRRECEGMCGV